MAGIVNTPGWGAAPVDTELARELADAVKTQSQPETEAIRTTPTEIGNVVDFLAQRIAARHRIPPKSALPVGTM